MTAKYFLLNVAICARISVSAATKSSERLAGAFVSQWGQMIFSVPSMRSWASNSKLASHF
ncbi:hypothetical protein D7Y13_02785 [Corallococcus praedator]|uniref:Uncharacterized protein n=1 Tax=Corallococcus praedator TaxID=2316724 RepID=A0ABX9QSY2_9BACT|nr:hypothetical protein D7X74_00480 [Corallococcus sp. CA047B]RKH36493.1 hypothetical protein D7X75_00225 [Corallococcus sp. CA031C]RKI16328.1 hypothetical protein D7Y13_02785 [Corallococcus praedator]